MRAVSAAAPAGAPDGPSPSAARWMGVLLVYLLAAAAYPVLHAHLSVTGAIVGPEGQTDFACLTCHGLDRGHVSPPDRSCLSCHLLDFDRRALAETCAIRPERVQTPFWVLAGAYALFCVSALAFVLRPSSPRRAAAALLSLLLLGGVAAAAFGASPDVRTWEVEGVRRDSALAVSPDGRFAIVSVRRRDTDGDGGVTTRDRKSLLLLEDGREVAVLAEGALTWQDRPVRWSSDGRLAVLLLPARRPGWTPYDPADVVVLDPAARAEVARWPDGMNPAWLWDGRLAFQRVNRILVAETSAGVVAEVDVAAAAAGDTDAAAVPGDGDPRAFRLRMFVVDPHRRRIVAAVVGRPGGVEKEGRLVAVTEAAAGRWSAERLPWIGHAPVPTADGLYLYVPRGDRSGNGRYEIGLDGVDLVRAVEPASPGGPAAPAETVAEDAALYGLFDLSGGRVALLRRPGAFDLVEVPPRGAAGRTLVAGLAPSPATWMTSGGGRVAMTAALPGEGSTPALHEWRAGAARPLAPPPALRPAAHARGACAVAAEGDEAGRVVETPWSEAPPDP